MNDFFIPQSTYAKLVREIGREAADRIVASGAPVRPDEVEFQPYNSVDVGGDNGMDEEDNADLAVATEDAADDTADEGVNLAVGPKTDELSQWENSQSAFLRKAQAQRKKQFEDAKAYIEQNYRGPSLSEQLFAMSEALLSPRSMPGFKGTMSNIAPVFGQIAKAQRTSAQQRAEALMKLQQQYQTGELEAQGDILQNRLNLIKARAAAAKKVGATPSARVGPDQRLRHTKYGTVIKIPVAEDIGELQTYLADPDVTEDLKAAARREFDGLYGYGASEIYGG